MEDRYHITVDLADEKRDGFKWLTRVCRYDDNLEGFSLVTTVYYEHRAGLVRLLTTIDRGPDWDFRLTALEDKGEPIHLFPSLTPEQAEWFGQGTK